MSVYVCVCVCVREHLVLLGGEEVGKEGPSRRKSGRL